MIALRQTVTLAMAFAMLSITSTSLASNSIALTSHISAAASAQDEEAPLVAPPSAADLAAANPEDQEKLIKAVVGSAPAQEPAPPMRSTIEQYLQIGAPIVPSFSLEAYQAAQQELPEFWPKSTPHEQDVCAPHKAVASTNHQQRDLAPFFGAGEFVTSRRTVGVDDESSNPQAGLRPEPRLVTPHDPRDSILDYGPYLEHVERTSDELAAEFEQVLQINQTETTGSFAVPKSDEAQFSSARDDSFAVAAARLEKPQPTQQDKWWFSALRPRDVELAAQIEQHLGGTWPTNVTAIIQTNAITTKLGQQQHAAIVRMTGLPVVATQNCPIQAEDQPASTTAVDLAQEPFIDTPAEDVPPVAPQEEFDLEDGEAAAELLPIFMRQQSALEGTVFGSDVQGEEQQLSVQRSFIERIRELEKTLGREKLGELLLAAPFEGELPPGGWGWSFDEDRSYTEEELREHRADSFQGFRSFMPQYEDYYQSYAGFENYPEVQAKQEEKATQDYAVEVLRNSAEQMEHSANLMERRNLFEEADKLRGMANELRMAARVRVQGESGVAAYPQYGMPANTYGSLPQSYEPAATEPGMRPTPPTIAPPINTPSVPYSFGPRPNAPMTDGNYYYENSGYPGQWQSSRAEAPNDYSFDFGDGSFEPGDNKTNSFQPFVPPNDAIPNHIPAAKNLPLPPADDANSYIVSGLYTAQDAAKGKRAAEAHREFFQPVSWDEGFFPGPGTLQMLEAERPVGWWIKFREFVDRDWN